MISRSPIRRKQISMSLSKLKKVSSDNRFRIKSLRMKTIDNETNTQSHKNLETNQQLHFPALTVSSNLPTSNNNIDKDYQKQLSKKGFSSDWLYNLYLTRSQQLKLKTSQIKYKAFVKSFYHRMVFTKSFNLASFNLGKEASKIFLNKFTKWNKQLISVNLSQCVDLENQHIINLIKNDRRTIKLKLNNMSLDQESINQILKAILQTATIYQLDLSNVNSHNMNRIGQDYNILYQFAKNNTSVGVLKLDSFTLHKIGLQTLTKGVSENMKKNPLKVLNVNNNSIGCNAFDTVTLLAKSGITHLDISENPLSPEFFYSLKSWKAITLKSINLSNTGLDSQSFCTFLSKVQENKSLQILKADRNDFSHHWFSQIKSILQINSSLQSLSLVNCNIKKLSTLFEGLMYNKYMKKVNISYNDGFQEQDYLFKRVYDCIQVNKILEQLKMRFCGLKPKHFLKIFQSIIQSKSLKIIDISQNQLSEEGAKAVLKALNQTDVLQNVIMQKVQITMRVKKQIDDRIKQNKQIREKQNFAYMKQENLRIRQKDEYTWEQLEQFETQVKVKQKQILELEHKVEHASKVLEKKKQKFAKYISQKKEQQKILDSKLKMLNRKKNNEMNLFLQKLKGIDKKTDDVIEEQQIQKRLIQTLQQKIRKQNQKIRNRQNELQDIYKNKKYINNKKKNDSVQKNPFDNTSSLIKKKNSIKPK